MPIEEVIVDSRTKEELGEAGLSDLRRRFGVGDCLACGRPLSRRRVAVVVDEFYSMTHATAYHPECQRPKWIDQGLTIVPKDRGISYHSLFFLGPDFRGLTPKPLPWLLVHPSLEVLQLKPHHGGGWESNDLALYFGIGLTAEPDPQVLQISIPGTRATIRRNSLVVSIAAQRWHCRGGDDEIQAVQAEGGVLIAVTTAIDPHDPMPFSEVLEAVQMADCALGWVPLNR